MPVSVTMPRLGESVSEGTVTRWLKKEGDQVEADEPLLEVSTDKVDTEIPAPASGVLTKIKVGEDETVEVGEELAVIDGEGGGAATQEAPPEQPAQQAQPEPEPEPEPAPEPPRAQQQAPQRQEAPRPPAQQAPPPPPQRQAPPPPPQRQAPPPPPQQQPQQSAPPAQPAAPAPEQADGEGGELYVTPLVRKLAAEHGVDLSTVPGTGVGGRIRKQDVLDAAKASRETAAPAAAAQPAAPAQPSAPVQPSPAAAALRGKTEKLTRMRALIAQRMVESLQTAAQLTTVVEVDVTKIAKLRERAKASFEAREGVKLSFLPFFAVAAVEALKQHPKLNASIDTEAGTVTYYDAEHLGIAVDTDRGLMVPTIRDAGDLNLGGMARKIADLATRTRDNHINPDELSGGTFTLTNTGSRGALFDTPILFQPQVGMLGTGTVVKRPVVVDDPDLGEVITVRSMVYLALTYDHRLVDGADAARFLVTIKQRLEEGAFEQDLGL
ncbi:MAG: 2-oxoglutarate dehydrogenase, E2 component, dihydrolipoamide succinyltransferase [Mycobacteriales bacterium]